MLVGVAFRLKRVGNIFLSNPDIQNLERGNQLFWGESFLEEYFRL